MKCSVCGDAAVIKLKRHNVKFCRKHFNQHIHKQIERAIHDFGMFSKEDTVLLAVSGGKDSMAAWEALATLGYNIKAVHINMGFGDYSFSSEKTAMQFSKDNKLFLANFTLENLLDFGFDKAINYTRKSPCSLCGTLKRYFLNKIALNMGVDALATAHNLSDEASFLLGNVLYWRDGYLKRQSPVLEAEPGMIKKVKPLIRITDEELKAYVELNKIPYYSGTCPNSKYVTTHFYKKILNQLEEKFPDIKAQFYFGFLEYFKKNIKEDYEKSRENTFNHYCPECGYKTLNKGKCFVCRLKERVRLNS